MMRSMHSAYDIYRRTLTSLEETDSVWWYLGTTTVQLPGHPEIIVNHVETVMIYRSENLTADSYRVPWWEIGVFRDAITGEVPESWLNPVTGNTLPAARTFEEGPSGFSIRATDRNGVEIFDAVQAHAILNTAQVEFRHEAGRVAITQTERKTRSFPGVDGTFDPSQNSQSETVLQFFADDADLDSGAPSVPSTGLYSFVLTTPAWLGFGDRPSTFAVKGLMHKAPMNAPLNPRGWADLQRLFPHYFESGQIKPHWR